MSAFLTRTARALKRLTSDRRGAIAPLYALLAVPLIISVGAGVDLSREVGARNDLQDATDSAGLALGRLPSTTDAATLTTQAGQWVVANATDKALGPINVTASASAGIVDIDATSTVTTSIMGMLGVKTMPIHAHSTAKYGIGHVEVALVLDNTGSMSADNKLTDLVSAAKSLVSTLLADNTPTDPDAVKISIVPFSQTVNVGASYQNASWMDGHASAYAGTSADLFSAANHNGTPVNRFTLLSNMGIAWGGCVETRPEWVNGSEKDYDILDVPSSTSLPGTQIVPYFAPDEPDSGGYNNSYLTDGTSSTDWSDFQSNISKYYTGSYSYHPCAKTNSDGSCKSFSTSTTTGNFRPSSFTHTGRTALDANYIYGPNSGCKLQAVQRLTTSASDLNTELNGMVAVGDTNVPMGLFWGWMTLSPNGPFSADVTPYGTPEVTKIIIVLTDGANHTNYGSGMNGGDSSFYSGMGYSWQHLISTDSGSFNDPVTAINNREAKICQNLKGKGIVIYAVPVEVDDDTAKSLLQGCASPDTSGGTHYIDVASASGLQAAFTNIAGSIGSLRISH